MQNSCQRSIGHGARVARLSSRGEGLAHRAWAYPSTRSHSPLGILAAPVVREPAAIVATSLAGCIRSGGGQCPLHQRPSDAGSLAPTAEATMAQAQPVVSRPMRQQQSGVVSALTLNGTAGATAETRLHHTVVNRDAMGGSLSQELSRLMPSPSAGAGVMDRGEHPEPRADAHQNLGASHRVGQQVRGRWPRNEPDETADISVSPAPSAAGRPERASMLLKSLGGAAHRR